jgi:hypothetical protein
MLAANRHHGFATAARLHSTESRALKEFGREMIREFPTV